MKIPCVAGLYATRLHPWAEGRLSNIARALGLP
jgi:hypothetical protein